MYLGYTIAASEKRRDLMGAYYHYNVNIISRGRKRADSSVTDHMAYIIAQKLEDTLTGETCDHTDKTDVRHWETLLPANAPEIFKDPQELCRAIDAAETRKNARTAREHVGALPNELPLDGMIRIAKRFIIRNFVRRGFCAVYAIHEGSEKDDPSQQNYHFHCLVPTRTLGSEGFGPKDRSEDKRDKMFLWRSSLEDAINLAYREYGIERSVSAKSLKDQGIDRKPTRRLSFPDYQREKLGEQTPAGDINRKIQKRNAEQEKRRKERERGIDRGR